MKRHDFNSCLFLGFSGSLEPLAMSVVEVKGLNYTHLNGTPALRNVDLDLPAGSRTLLIGGNGVGKSTLLQILGESIPYCSRELFLTCLAAGKRMVKGEKVAILGHDVFRQSPKVRSRHNPDYKPL